MNLVAKVRLDSGITESSCTNLLLLQLSCKGVTRRACSHADGWAPPPELVRPGRGLGVCIPNKLPGDADGAVWGPGLENHELTISAWSLHLDRTLEMTEKWETGDSFKGESSQVMLLD